MAMFSTTSVDINLLLVFMF